MLIGSVLDHSQYLGKALDAAWMRNSVIINNMSNISTPDFKASKVEFETLLNDAISGGSTSMKKTRGKHFGVSENDIEPVITQDVDSEIRMDGNNVDMNSQQAALAENTLKYYTLISKLSKDLARMRYAVESK